jgi:hypothetical protein
MVSIRRETSRRYRFLCGGDFLHSPFAAVLVQHDGRLNRRFAALHAAWLTYSPAMTRSALVKCAVVLALTAGVLTVRPQATALADSCSDVASTAAVAIDSGPCADVLAQERRWLTAITDGDRTTVESILAPVFKHIDSEGALLDRAQEIAGMEKVSFTMNATDQLVDISGDTAVIHGVNTLVDGGEVLARERFTDVFMLQNGTWMALSAQETTLR